MRARCGTWVGGLIAVGFAFATMIAQAQTSAPASTPTPATREAAAAPAGAGGGPGAACLKCHDDDVGGMLATKHAVSGDPRSPWGRGKACVGCHGESTEHIRNTKVPPTVVFAKTTPASVRNGACLACHKGGKRMHFDGSIHERNDVACNDCHHPHKAVDQVRVAQTQAGVCFDCHKDKRAASLRASSHPIRTGAMP
ncbi:MAG TPA: cytochrome c3 family protein, partial [Casimicrobiaceae bacterium]